MNLYHKNTNNYKIFPSCTAGIISFLATAMVEVAVMAIIIAPAAIIISVVMETIILIINMAAIATTTTNWAHTDWTIDTKNLLPTSLHSSLSGRKYHLLQ